MRTLARPAFLRLAAACTFAFAVAMPLPALAQNAVVATVNGDPITEGEVALALEDLALQYPQMPPAQRQSVALDFLIEVKLASQVAAKDKLDQGDDFKRKLAYARERILMERLLAREGDKASSPAALKAFYDEQVKQIKPVEEVRARHILVSEEAEAKAALARVKGGEDFAKVAAAVSKDPGSGKEGGDLGFFTKDRMVPEFAEAAFALKVGEVSDLVKSQFGFHIIKLEERRTRPVPGFDEVKDRLVGALANKAQSEYLTKLREGAKIERRDAPEKKQ